MVCSNRGRDYIRCRFGVSSSLVDMNLNRQQQQLSDLKKSSKDIMEGELKKTTFTSSDGYKYYRVKGDAKKTKLYLRCSKFYQGCRVRIRTEYSEGDAKNLRVIYSTGVHNHPPRSDDNNRNVGRRKTECTCKTLKTEHRNVSSGLKYVVYIY